MPWSVTLNSNNMQCANICYSLLGTRGPCGGASASSASSRPSSAPNAPKNRATTPSTSTSATLAGRHRGAWPLSTRRQRTPSWKSVTRAVRRAAIRNSKHSASSSDDAPPLRMASNVMTSDVGLALQRGASVACAVATDYL